MVADFLKPHGFDVLVENRGDRAVHRILHEDPEVVILDVNLPGMDGFAICREVRGDYGGAIIMLTARGGEIDEVLGLEVGRVVKDPVRGFHLEVGVGRYDREAARLMEALRSVEEVTATVLDVVRGHRRSDQPPHLLNRLARQRWLRAGPPCSLHISLFTDDGHEPTS